MIGLCKSCKFWNETSDMGPSFKRTGMKGCESPTFHASYSEPEGRVIFRNGMWCESDEGWGMVTAPNFGCVNFKEHSP
jgi:hypothetical protein